MGARGKRAGTRGKRAGREGRPWQFGCDQLEINKRAVVINRGQMERGKGRPWQFGCDQLEINKGQRAVEINKGRL